MASEKEVVKEAVKEGINKSKVEAKAEVRRGDELLRYFRLGVLVILMLLLLVATFHFYFSVVSAVASLFEYRYQALVTAGFAACVIAVVAYLLRVVVRW
ncbi:hypothetical protein [Candidatus Alkanophaga liquidiphilum]|nr:hypothetical protein [Candidatus Alkanophaga liquidiphilum]RLG38107.1 MAG: hypothetical protein DRN91_03600 [Candidatus Alkanophagales archaeon]